MYKGSVGGEGALSFFESVVGCVPKPCWRRRSPPSAADHGRTGWDQTRDTVQRAEQRRRWVAEERRRATVGGDRERLLGQREQHGLLMKAV